MVIWLNNESDYSNWFNDYDTNYGVYDMTGPCTWGCLNFLETWINKYHIHTTDKLNTVECMHGISVLHVETLLPWLFQIILS